MSKAKGKMPKIGPMTDELEKNDKGQMPVEQFQSSNEKTRRPKNTTLQVSYLDAAMRHLVQCLSDHFTGVSFRANARNLELVTGY
jgi:hypothetical protein